MSKYELSKRGLLGGLRIGKLDFLWALCLIEWNFAIESSIIFMQMKGYSPPQLK